MLCLALLAVAWIKPERDLVCSPEPLVYRVLQIAMWSRYNESSSQSWPVSAHEEGVTPFSRYPLQDTFYNTLAYSHIVFAVPYLSLILWQFLATKGTPDHVQRGLVLKWLALCVVGGGWMLQIRHSWFSDPKVFEKHPVLFSLPFARSFVSAFGTSTVVSALSCYLLGVKDKSRLAPAKGTRHLIILAAVLASLAVDVNAYVYIIQHLVKLPAWSSYGWEMLWEMTVIGSVFPLYDGLNAFVLLTWWHTGNLNYVEHHVMNAVWTMSKTCAAVLLFSAHDAHWFWPHPGLGLFQRWAVQLVPQLLILLPYLLRIFKHVAAAPSYQEYNALSPREVPGRKN
ncbi:Uncharacterized protein SCF082_LOCUS50691 [Durusdinium trenchii]